MSSFAWLASLWRGQDGDEDSPKTPPPGALGGRSQQSPKTGRIESEFRWPDSTESGWPLSTETPGRIQPNFAPKRILQRIERKILSMRIIWQIAARRKLTQILAFISADSPTEAKKYTNELFDRTNSILAFPEIGKVYNISGDSVVRIIVIDKTKSVLYRVDRDKILILNIFDNRQDWKIST
jgi:plasmid stabilization system protein ParE